MGCQQAHRLPSTQTVLQCLYSQCQTAQFASALHHAIAQCFDNDSQSNDIPPALIRHQGLRLRAIPRAYAITSISASAFHSVASRQSSCSAPGSTRPTRSAAYTSLSTYVTPSALPTSPFCKVQNNRIQCNSDS